MLASDIYRDETMPEPSAEDRANGWVIDPKYLRRIAKLVGQDWERPTLETVQYVLLAHGAQRFRFT